MSFNFGEGSFNSKKFSKLSIAKVKTHPLSQFSLLWGGGFISKVALGIFGASLFIEVFQGVAWKLLVITTFIRALIHKKWILTVDFSFLLLFLIFLTNTLLKSSSPEVLSTFKFALFYIVGIGLRGCEKLGKFMVTGMVIGLLSYLSITFLFSIDAFEALTFSNTKIFRLRLPPGSNTSSFYVLFLMFYFFISPKINESRTLRIGCVLCFLTLLLLLNLKAAYISVATLAVVSYFIRLKKVFHSLLIIGVLASFVGLFTNFTVNERLMFSGVKALYGKLGIKVEYEDGVENSGVRKVENSLSNGRFLIWAVALRGISENWFLGLGRRSFSHEYLTLKDKLLSDINSDWKEYFDEGYVESSEPVRSAHNLYLGLLFEFGLVGFGTFLIFSLISLKANLHLVHAGGEGLFFAWLIVLLTFPIGHYFIFRPILEITTMFFSLTVGSFESRMRKTI